MLFDVKKRAKRYGGLKDFKDREFSHSDASFLAPCPSSINSRRVKDNMGKAIRH